jgi:uncharacterized protein with ParB-like and HNH nuclease domain
MKFKDIPQRIGFVGNYHCNQSWKYLEKWIIEQEQDANLDLDPDFQRGHVWSNKQKIDYVEFILSGGKSSKDLLFNCPNWMNGRGKPHLVLVDGKQRLNSARQFLRNEIKAFGFYYREFEDKLPLNAEFIIYVNELQTTEEVLRWYLELNAGGTPHSKQEIKRVKELLEAERLESKKQQVSTSRG